MLAKSFSHAELMELLLAAGFWRMIAGYLKTTKVPLDADVPGWPEGRHRRSKRLVRRNRGIKGFLRVGVTGCGRHVRALD